MTANLTFKHFAVLCAVFIISQIFIDWCYTFTHILPCYFTTTGAIIQFASVPMKNPSIPTWLENYSKPVSPIIQRITCSIGQRITDQLTILAMDIDNMADSCSALPSSCEWLKLITERDPQNPTVEDINTLFVTLSKLDISPFCKCICCLTIRITESHSYLTSIMTISIHSAEQVSIALA